MFKHSVFLLLAALVAVCSCKPKPNAQPALENPKPKAEPGATASASSVFQPGHLFTEITGEAGLDQHPPPYPDGTYMTPEITPSGIAVFDFDNDGLLDLLQIRHPPPMPWEQMIVATEPNRLYRQQPDGRFSLVENAGGLGGRGYHNGVAIGDVNNDGWQDVYVCNYGGPDQFFLNNGNGTFRDVTSEAGFLSGATAVLTSPQNWSSTAAFFDCDRDGDLDLWVVHFATFDPSKRCRPAGKPAELNYCNPRVFPGQLATLWRNEGAGKFTDITEESGIYAAARGWGVIAADVTGDGLPDVFQANDLEPNQLWVNRGDGTFADEAFLRGCALNAMGSVESNMGVAIGDVRRTGDASFFATHFTDESNTIWIGDADGLFGDATAAAGMAAIDRPYTGWGCGFFDFNNDGFLDLAIANGRVTRGPVLPGAGLTPFWNRFAEPNLLFRGDGDNRFTDVSQIAGDFTKLLEGHRALAFADLRNRGRVDLLVGNIDNTLRIFRNDAVPPENHWLQVLPMLEKREALGAKVTLVSGGARRSAFCLRAYSYVSSNDPRVHFGLGETAKAEAVEIAWPSGIPAREKFEVPGVDRVLILGQGEGAAIE